MGNTTGKLDRCFAGEVSRRSDAVPVSISDLVDEGFGHSFCYIRPQLSRFSSSKVCSLESPAPPFKTISGAAISANTSTPLSTTLVDPIPCVDKASSFESSDCFSSIPLQPIPRSLVSSDPSGPMWNASGGSGDVERGFVSDPMERSFIWSPVENRSGQLTKYKPKFKNWSLIKTLKRAISKSNILSVGGTREKEGTSSSDKISTENITETSGGSNNLSSHSSDSEEDEFLETQNVEWAQGKAGEDRVHVVVSEENGWVFAGIYDGFNGPDATDFLQNNLYSNVYKELKGLLWNEKPGSSVNHSDVLKALSMALRKTEEAFLDITDLMMMENPELALMGSCVLVMLMKGDNVYLMNVGDSRAVLAQKVELERIVEESSISTDLETFEADECKKVSTLSSSQLTIDHSTSMKEEVKRIKLEHLDDSSAISKNRVKGSLKVTRAFGAGYLKQPKWNNALLEMFRINYVGNSPYISCSPALYHHKLGLRDRFLILSSDGLYQYFTNEEAVAEVEMFISLSPGGDPAQHLVEEVLFRAAKQAGLKFHELLDIPQGDRRKYHDDVSIIIISFEGSIWRSSLSL